MAEIIAEPTALSKVIALKFKINDVDVPKTTQLSTNKQFNTTDTDAWFTFELDGLASTSGTYDLTLINLDDKSIFHHADMIFPALPFHYKLNSSEDVTLNEIRHAGRWLGQLVVTMSNGDTTARQFGFNIAGHILDGQDAQVILLSDYQALINTINLAKDELEQYNINYSDLLADIEAAETSRAQTFESYDNRIEQIETGVKHEVTNIIETNSDFTTTDGIATFGASVAVANNVMTITGSGSASNPNAGFNLLNIPTGNKIYMRVWARVLNDVCQKITIRSESTETSAIAANPVNGQWYELATVRTKNGALESALNMSMTHTYADSATASGKTMEVKWAVAINLTDDFDAGSEPTADYTNLMLKIFPEKYFVGTQSVYPLQVLANDMTDAYQVIDDKFDAFVQTNIVQTEVAAVYDNLETTYAEDLVSVKSQLEQKANKDEVTNIMTPKGNKLYNSLPTTGNTIGDYYYSSDGDGVNGAGNYVWNGTSWYFGGTGDEGYSLLNNQLSEYTNALGHNTNMMDSLVCGYDTTYNDTLMFNSGRLTRVISKAMYKVKKTDILRLSVDSDSDYRANIVKYNTDCTEYLGTLDKWNSTGTLEEVVNFDGWVFVIIKYKSDSVDLSGLLGDIKTTVHANIISNENKPQISDYFWGERVSGNNTSVSIVEVGTFARTDFIRVFEGDLFNVNVNIAGTPSNSNMTGVAGFTDKSITSFSKWLLNNEIEGISTDTPTKYIDKEITIPPGINYIMVSTQLKSGQTASIARSVNLKSSSLERLGNIVDSLNDNATGNTIDNPEVGLHVLTGEPKVTPSGESILVVTPNKKNILMDTHDSRLMYWELIKKIEAINGVKIDYLCISHYHSDHIGCLEYWIDNNYQSRGFIDLTGATVFLPPLLTEEGLANVAGGQTLVAKQNKIIDFLTNSNCTIIHPTENSEYEIDGITLRFNNCNHELYEGGVSTNYNDWSLVFSVEYGNFNFINTADIGPIAQDTIGGSLKKATIMTAPHHGWDNGVNNLRPSFINNVVPDVVVSPNGSEHYPSLENTNAANVLNASSAMQTWCERNNVSNYMTCTNGQINILINKYGWKFDGNYSRFIRNDKNWAFTDNSEYIE